MTKNHPYHPTTEKLYEILNKKTALVNELGCELYTNKNRLTGEDLTSGEHDEIHAEFLKLQKEVDAIKLLMDTPDFIADLTAKDYSMEH